MTVAVDDDLWSAIGDPTRRRMLDLLLASGAGLFRDMECFDVCADAWGGYIGGSLRNLIMTGEGSPNVNNVADEIEPRPALT